MLASDEIREYIAFRHANWHDYARQMARVYKFEGWEDDLLDEAIIAILEKPEEKIHSMLQRRTAKIVNGRPTTELDKFILLIMNRNATSPAAPFRKNTLGEKITSRRNKTIKAAKHVPLNGYDRAADEFDTSAAEKLDRMHSRNIKLLRANGFTPDAIALYRRIVEQSGRPATEFEETAINNITKFLITQ
ncbi:MAG: hypothetical protein A2W90_02465 [Bacteroidetes bacterium GWF2_42_66]|nr:MAG: hypothetical protein A2W89_15950 [Bacteroidetes bacterium GWE2_42_39]OFY42057.1 MAG: hypothetical protein A2W90_02465 [Bacteroidetes bacterium GWF2_42_66]HBL77740.1 hypothetical protein [Prolixibacteraceae bacterium]HCB62869.1 hypothetical protein [Bacteroidales bacterium]